MSILIDWQHKFKQAREELFYSSEEIPLINPLWEELKELPSADQLCKEEQEMIGEACGQFNLGLEMLGDTLAECSTDDIGWTEGWEALTSLSSKGYPTASLMCAHVCSMLSAEDPSCLADVDVYFAKAKDSPYCTPDMAEYIEMHKHLYELSFDKSFPDLKQYQGAAAKDEQCKAEEAIMCLGMAALQHDNRFAAERLHTLSDRGYVKAYQLVQEMEKGQAVKHVASRTYKSDKADRQHE